jgi:endonuclease/exonuclease/phosphatase family metal-dependent hydrolase
MDAYIAKINSIAGAGAYSYVRGHQYAFVYKNSTITKKASGLYSGSKTFTYSPLRGNFAVKNGNFDFALLTIHTSPSKAKTEIPALTTAMAETRTYYNEQDVICLGDFNADGSYYSAGSTGGDLAGFPSPTYITVIKNGTDTTVSPNNSYTYDRMQLFSASAQDYAGNKGVLKFADYYTISNLEGASTTAGKETALSDHYPIWAEFYAGRDSD